VHRLTQVPLQNQVHRLTQVLQSIQARRLIRRTQLRETTNQGVRLCLEKRKTKTMPKRPW
jgi:hypothetical protein